MQKLFSRFTLLTVVWLESYFRPASEANVFDKVVAFIPTNTHSESTSEIKKKTRYVSFDRLLSKEYMYI